MKKISLIILAITAINAAINAQKVDSLPKLDTTKIELDSEALAAIKKKAEFPIPRKALFLSLALPGAGQFYNKKLWYIKVPIIYGAAVGGVLYLNFNKTKLDYYSQQYYNRVNKIPSDPALDPYQTTAIKQVRDNFKKSYEESYLYIGLGYLLVAAEAFTTAHLAHFDVSNDLSLKLKPVFETLPLGQSIAGIGIALSW